MNYQDYVVAAYAVFAVAMLWDLVVPRLELRRELRAARLRAMRRSAATSTPDPSAPLLRD